MSDETLEQTSTEQSLDPEAVPTDAPLPAPDDPGGARTKGYSADPVPQPDVEDRDPLPLAPGPDVHPAVRVPERDADVQPTGRSEPGGYGPNDRLMGSDR